MNQSSFLIEDTDIKGNAIKISCEGVDDKKLAHFGGLDLHVKAARTLISATYSPMDFPEKEGDFNVGIKVVALLLNEIGELIRNVNLDDRTDVSNYDLVREFLEDAEVNPVIKKMVDEDNSLNRRYKERMREEEDEFIDF
ncbi:hypothetical protein NDS46_31685 (plasmid) [Paenibacillus thiaminolyticus]|uniref:hypothetical protein n=1 Tax=Paenibacillus thiaminolyticus TaxID=49283 RepID=UPI00232BFFEC|nr:hypothetical protein [Paenibacillus thiaminolyticus]WCF11521.1 hypothetical protein NDS46_31685 [Paenibacillus thiaminolyticus]